MMKLVWSLFVLVLFTVSISAQQGQDPAQSQQNAEQEKAWRELENKGLTLINQIADEAAALKLAENRIFVSIAAGEMLWTHDEKRARRLLQTAAAEISQVYLQTDETDYKKQNIFYAISNQRQQMIYRIGQLDPEFALELLRQTRPPSVRAYLESNEAERGKVANQTVYQMQTEIGLEQNLAIMTAQKNPARAVEVARESLKRGATHNLFGLIEKIKQNDAKTAAQIADELAAKLLAAEWTPNNDMRSIANSFINFYAPPPAKSGESAEAQPLAIPEKTFRDLAEKIAAFYLSGPNSQMYGMSDIEYVLPAIERYAPNRTATLRRRAEEFTAANPDQQIYQKLSKLQQDGTAEQILAELDNYPSEYRPQLYQAASDKYRSAGDSERARRVLESIPSKGERENALQSFESNRYYEALGGDKLEDAYKIAVGINNDNTKFESLNNLALAYHRKKQPEMAAKVLEEAQRFVVVPPADEEEMQRVLRLARTLAVIAPARSIALLEPLVGQANELITASITINKFYKNNAYNFREEEWLISYLSSSGWGANDGTTLLLLAEHDFAALVNIVDRIERSDIRLGVRLMLAQAALAKRTASSNNGTQKVTAPTNTRTFVISSRPQ